MDPTLVSNAVSEFTEAVLAARRALRTLHECRLGAYAGYEREHECEFVDHLELLSRRLPVLLDLIGMSNTRERFLASWEDVSSDLGELKERLDCWGDHYLESKPLQLITEITDVLGSMVPTAKQRGVAAQIEILEYVLRSIPKILTVRGIAPSRESDIQGPLHQHLENTFPDYSRRVQLPKGMKSFEPDGAIQSLKALIELKFVDTREKAKTALSGIKEDLSGYGGYRDWTRFFSIIYQTRNFEIETRFQKSLQLSGKAEGWKVIIVTGDGRGGQGETKKWQEADKDT